MSENELTADGRALCRADRAKARDYVWLDRANAVLAEERKKREAAQGWSDARKCRLKSKQQAWQSAQRLAARSPVQGLRTATTVGRGRSPRSAGCEAASA